MFIGLLLNVNIDLQMTPESIQGTIQSINQSINIT